MRVHDLIEVLCSATFFAISKLYLVSYITLEFLISCGSYSPVSDYWD